MVPAKPISSYSHGECEDEEKAGAREKEIAAVAMTKEEKLKERYLKGIKKRKCSACGNSARSRCPFRVCKACCVDAQNRCSVHVYRNFQQVQSGANHFKATSSGGAVGRPKSGRLPFSGPSSSSSGLQNPSYSGVGRQSSIVGTMAAAEVAPSTSGQTPFRADQRSWIHSNGIGKMASTMQMNMFSSASTAQNAQASMTTPGSRPGTPLPGQGGFPVGVVPPMAGRVSVGKSWGTGAATDATGVKAQQRLAQEAGMMNMMGPWVVQSKAAPTPEQQYLLRLKSLRAIVHVYQKESALTHAWRLQKLWEHEEAELEFEDEALGRFVQNAGMLAELFSGDINHLSSSADVENSGGRAAAEDPTLQSLTSRLLSEARNADISAEPCTLTSASMETAELGGCSLPEPGAGPGEVGSVKEVLQRLLREGRAVDVTSENDREDKDGGEMGVRRKRQRKGLGGGNGSAKRLDTLDLLLDQADRVRTNKEIAACEMAYQEAYGWKLVLPRFPGRGEDDDDDDGDSDLSGREEEAGYGEAMENYKSDSVLRFAGQGEGEDERGRHLSSNSETPFGDCWPRLAKSWWPVSMNNPRTVAICRHMAETVTDIQRL